MKLVNFFGIWHAEEEKNDKSVHKISQVWLSLRPHSSARRQKFNKSRTTNMQITSFFILSPPTHTQQMLLIQTRVSSPVRAVGLFQTGCRCIFVELEEGRRRGRGVQGGGRGRASGPPWAAFLCSLFYHEQEVKFRALFIMALISLAKNFVIISMCKSQSCSHLGRKL